MRHLHTTLGSITVTVIILLLGIGQRVFAAVTLSSFTATYNNDYEEVKLEWVTQSEVDTVGYFIVRSTDRNALLNAEPVNYPADWPSHIPFVSDLEVDGEEVMRVPSAGSVTSGATYLALDAGPEEGLIENETYYYLLVEQELTGKLVPFNDQPSRVLAVAIVEFGPKVWAPIILR